MPVSLVDFNFVRELVYDRCAIALDDSKDYLVEARLAPIVLREGFPSVAELVASLRSGDETLRDDVVAAVATNETSFFRDLHPFDALRDVVIPSVLAGNGGRRLHMWSAATSSGQEAFSLAMVARAHVPRIPDLSILGSDMSTAVLTRARRGRYSQLEVNRGLPARLLVEHFTRDGREWQLNADVLDQVTFRRVNLARPFVGIPPMDVIFLRNVLIYFDAARKAEVLAQVARVLRPGGYLFLGGSETTYGIHSAFDRMHIGKAVCHRLISPDRSTSADDQR
jgi:chemotaxis protein methyltransferase CheR